MGRDISAMDFIQYTESHVCLRGAPPGQGADEFVNQDGDVLSKHNLTTFGSFSMCQLLLQNCKKPRILPG